MTKDVIDCIKERRSIRRFKSDAVPEPTLGRLIEAARCAPSAGNIQPWQFAVVLNKQVRRELADASGGKSYIAEAPACIVVSAEPERSAARYGDRGEELYCIQDTAAAAQNIMLAATAYGLGACWVGDFDEQAVKLAVGDEDSRRPVALIPVGYPAEDGQESAMRSQDEVTRVIH